MSVDLVLFWDWAADTPETGISEASRAMLHELLNALPGLELAHIFTPAKTDDIYTDDGRSPPLGLQLSFASISALEAAAGETGALQALFTKEALPGLRPEQANAQAFLRRDFAVDAPDHAPGAKPCSFVVHYPGPAADPLAWHDYYIKGHPPLMRKMPGVRAIEILTPVVWLQALPIARADHMQRNRVTFDSAEALTAALQSPIRHELREDFHHLPAFEGGNKHHAMLVDTIRR